MLERLGEQSLNTLAQGILRVLLTAAVLRLVKSRRRHRGRIPASSTFEGRPMWPGGRRHPGHVHRRHRAEPGQSDPHAVGGDGSGCRRDGERRPTGS